MLLIFGEPAWLLLVMLRCASWLSRYGGCWRVTPGRWFTSWIPAGAAVDKVTLRDQTNGGHRQVDRLIVSLF